MKHNLKGFTLTELLAVVIILSILTGIAAGTYKKAVERSRFSDGLNMASSVMSAVERYFYDDPTRTDAKYPTKDKLDISFDNQGTCSSSPNYCFKTKYYETTITNSNYTEAKRANNLYRVRVYSSAFGTNTRVAPQCIGIGNEGKNFCVSVGYSSCTGSGPYTCSKP